MRRLHSAGATVESYTNNLNICRLQQPEHSVRRLKGRSGQSQNGAYEDQNCRQSQDVLCCHDDSGARFLVFAYIAQKKELIWHVVYISNMNAANTCRRHA